MDLSVIGCEDGRWMKLVHGRVHWRALVLAVLNLLLVLPVSFSSNQQPVTSVYTGINITPVI
jgi:hypothetical protein